MFPAVPSVILICGTGIMLTQLRPTRRPAASLRRPARAGVEEQLPLVDPREHRRRWRSRKARSSQPRSVRDGHQPRGHALRGQRAASICDTPSIAPRARVAPGRDGRGDALGRAATSAKLR